MKDLYVSKIGNDRNCGTLEKPFATVEAARDAIRALSAEERKEDVTVREGAIYLELHNLNTYPLQIDELE